VSDFLRLGEHAEGFDPIEPGQHGTLDRPFLLAPPDNALPYGAWCQCGKCGKLGRSTIAFDFYGSEGEPLRCERCELER